MANKKIKITQVKSRIGYSRKAKATLDALGLRKINQSVVLDLNDSIYGMVKKIDYLIKVEEVKWNKLNQLIHSKNQSELVEVLGLD